MQGMSLPVQQEHVRHEDQVMKRWKLHGNISRKGYGNALIGRYGSSFEETQKEVYDNRAYHAKGLDVPAKVDTNSWSEKEAMHGTREASKYEDVEVSTFNTYISPKKSCTYYR